MKKIYRKPETEVIETSGESLLLDTSNIPVGGGGTTHAPAIRAIEDDGESLLEE